MRGEEVGHDDVNDFLGDAVVGGGFKYDSCEWGLYIVSGETVVEEEFLPQEVVHQRRRCEQCIRRGMTGVNLLHREYIMLHPPL